MMPSIHILGKGRNGGKHRNIAWHPLTGARCKEALDIRDKEIEKARKKNPNVQVPPFILIYEANGQLKTYKKSWVEKRFEKLGRTMGFHFSNHDLRRTCGHMMYRAGVPTEEIARLYGHSDTRTTIHYLGLDLEDLSGAMMKYADYQASLIVPKNGTFAKSQMLSGQGGIRTPGFRLAKAAIFR
jgi:integrase/recombinase XerD